jgi:hypothetical protein
MESPKFDKEEADVLANHGLSSDDDDEEADVLANHGLSSDDDDDMVICSSRDLERQQSVVENGLIGELYDRPEGCPTGHDNEGGEDASEGNNSQDVSSDSVTSKNDSSKRESTTDQKPESVLWNSRSEETENGSDSKSADVSFDLEIKDENSNTQFCCDKSALELMQKTDYEEINLSKTNVDTNMTNAQVITKTEKAEIDSFSKMDESSLEIDKSFAVNSMSISSSADNDKSIIETVPSFESDSKSVEVNKASSVEANRLASLGIKNFTEDEGEDAVVVAASWMEPFEDNFQDIDMNDKDAAITQLKSQVTKLTSVIRVKDETLKFIEEQTKAEVDKMSAEITLLRASLVDEQKKVTKLEEDVKKRDDVIKKFKSSFERIGKAVSIVFAFVVIVLCLLFWLISRLVILRLYSDDDEMSHILYPKSK